MFYHPLQISTPKGFAAKSFESDTVIYHYKHHEKHKQQPETNYNYSSQTEARNLDQWILQEA